MDGRSGSAGNLLELNPSPHIGSSTLNLQRLFSRSMSGPDPAEPIAPPSPRSAKRKLMFVSLAGILAIVGALAAGYYFAMRPVMLRIAVGPANSDDLKVVQTLAQAFSHQTTSQIRLRPVPTEGANPSAQPLADGKADVPTTPGIIE